MTRQDFSRRSQATELMDTNPVSFEEFDDYLRDLERINILTLAYRPTLLWLKRAVADLPAGQTISVLDVGSGGGGMLRQLRKWARGKNLKLDLTGVDVNLWSTNPAEESSMPRSCGFYGSGNLVSLNEREIPTTCEGSDLIGKTMGN